MLRAKAARDPGGETKSPGAGVIQGRIVYGNKDVILKRFSWARRDGVHDARCQTGVYTKVNEVFQSPANKVTPGAVRAQQPVNPADYR